MQGGRSTNWRIIMSQKFIHRSESSEPHIRLPSLGVWHRVEDPPEHLALKASRAWLQELCRTGGGRDSTLGGHTQGLAHTGSQGRGNDFKGGWATLTCWIGGSPGEAGCGCGSPWGCRHWWWRLQGVFSYVNSWGGWHLAWVTSTKIWPYPTACRLQYWDASGQTTNRSGTQPQPSTGRLPKNFLSPQPILDTSLDTALPTRGPRASSTHQWAGTGPSHQKACTSL